MDVLKPHLFFIRVVGHIASSLHSGMDCSQDAVFINSGLIGYRNLLAILLNLAQFVSDVNLHDQDNNSETLGISMEGICYWIDYVLTSAWCHSKQFALMLVNRLLLSNVNHLLKSHQQHSSVSDISVLRVWRLCFTDLIVPCLHALAETSQPPAATNGANDCGTARCDNVFVSDPELRQPGSQLSTDFLKLFVHLFIRLFPIVSHMLSTTTTAQFSPWLGIHRDLVTGLGILEQIFVSKSDKRFLDRNSLFIAKSISKMIPHQANALDAVDHDGSIRDKMMKILRNCVLITNSRFEELLYQFPTLFANNSNINSTAASSPSTVSPDDVSLQNQDLILEFGGMGDEEEDLLNPQQQEGENDDDDSNLNVDSDEGRILVMQKAATVFQLTKISLTEGVFKWPENVPAIVDTVLVLTRFVGNFAGAESGVGMVDILLHMHTRIVTEMTALKARSEHLSVWIRAWIYAMRGLAAQVVGVGGATTSSQISSSGGSAVGGSSREVRNAAAISLQRALLDNNLSPGAELIESCIRNVLFVLIEELTRRKLAIVSETSANSSGMRRSSSYNSMRSRRIEDFEEMQMRASSLLVKIVLRYLGEFTAVKNGNERPSNDSFPRLWLDLLEVLKKCVITAHADLLIEAIHESLKNMLLVFHAQDVFSEWAGLWEPTRIKLEQFIPDLVREVMPLHQQNAPNKNAEQQQQSTTPPPTAPDDSAQFQPPTGGTLKI